jgi:hypothetical protein
MATAATSAAGPREERMAYPHSLAFATPMPRRVLEAGLALVLAVVMLGLALPRLAAAVWDQLQKPALEALHAGQPLRAGELRALIAAQGLALAWVDAPQHHARLAAAQLRLIGMESADDPSAHALFEPALAAAERGLAAAPSDPRGWLLLAYLVTLRDGPGRVPAGALTLSLRSGPFDRSDVLARRLELMLVNWAFLDPAARLAAPDQIRLLWETAPEAVLDLAADAPTRALFAAALADRLDAREALRGVAERSDPRTGSGTARE